MAQRQVRDFHALPFGRISAIIAQYRIPELIPKSHCPGGNGFALDDDCVDLGGNFGPEKKNLDPPPRRPFSEQNGLNVFH